MRETQSDPADEMLRTGQMVAQKYRIERELSRGSRGVVVAATQVKATHPVALKLIPPAVLSGSEDYRRLQRELRVAQELRGAHSVRLLEVGREENGLAFIAMELLEGESLASTLARGPAVRPVDEAVGYLVAACHGVGEAHARQAAHRTLKPAHLFLAQRADGKRIVKVLDFGSWVLGVPPKASQAPRLAHLRYQAPEQLSQGRPVDGRADVWALGCILYELLAGEAPFPETDEATLFSAILSREAIALSKRCPDLPAGLVGAVGRCLSKDSVQRFANSAELALQLRPFQENRPTAKRTGLQRPALPSPAAPLAAQNQPNPPAPVMLAPQGGPLAAAAPPLANAGTLWKDASNQREARSGREGPAPRSALQSEAKPESALTSRLRELTDEELQGIGKSDVVGRLLETFRSPNYRPPRLPAAAVQLLDLTRKSDVAVGQIVTLLQNEQLLAAELLKLAQSARYSGNASVRTLDEAIVRLGIPRTADLFLEAALNMRVFRAPGYQEQLDRLRRHSAAVAQLARSVSQKTQVNESHAFLCGLLHDIGIAAALIAFAELGPRGAAPGFDLVWPAIFEAHEECAGVLARLWQLPAEVGLVISHHHQIMMSGRVHPTVAAIVLAEWLASQVGMGFDDIDEGAVRLARETLKLDQSTLDRQLGVAAELANQI